MPAARLPTSCTPDLRRRPDLRADPVLWMLTVASRWSLGKIGRWVDRRKEGKRVDASDRVSLRPLPAEDQRKVVDAIGGSQGTVP